MNTNQTHKLICVAAIAGAFGIKGEVKLKSFTQDPKACLSYGPLRNEAGDIILTPQSHRKIKDYFAVRAPEIKTREMAEELKSTRLYISREALPDTDEDDFYYSDLIGLDVKSTDGKRLGTVIGVHDFGAGDMLEIKPPKNAVKKASWFHPFRKASVPKIDLAARRIIIVPFDTD